MELNIENLKKLRSYFASGEWKKNGRFDMKDFWDDETKCGCLIGHSMKFLNLSSEDYVEGMDIYGEMPLSDMWKFLFSARWASYDNTVEGAIGRIDAVIDGLKF